MMDSTAMAAAPGRASDGRPPTITPDDAGVDPWCIQAATRLPLAHPLVRLESRLASGARPDTQGGAGDRGSAAMPGIRSRWTCRSFPGAQLQMPTTHPMREGARA